MGDPPVVTDHPATMCDELLDGAHGGAWWRERLELVALGAQQSALECGIGRVIVGPAGREGCAVARQRQGGAGEEAQPVILAQGEDQGTLVAFEADRHGVAVEPCAPCGGPTRRWPRACTRAARTHVVGSPQPGGPHCVWHPPSRYPQRQHLCQGLSAACVISQRVLEWQEGTCALTCCAGMRESRERGRPCGGVDERQRTRGGEDMFVSSACYGLHMRLPWGHVPAVPDGYLPGVHSITDSRTVYLENACRATRNSGSEGRADAIPRA
jgi:hypothetical protein